ncbi:hypothetical protein ACFL6D_04395 [Spirochaetota bacterium]
MLKIAHRINTIEQLKDIPRSYGVEIDIRYHEDTLLLHHEPFTTGVPLNEWLSHYSHSLIILNTKSEGMEEAILDLLKKHHVSSYFFLDLSIPFMIKQIKTGLRDIAVRFSEYEPIEFVLKFKDKVDWVWIDCFSGEPIKMDDYKKLKEHFKLCLVSPELQGYSYEKIDYFKNNLENMRIDAVCTKKPDMW